LKFRACFQYISMLGLYEELGMKRVFVLSRHSLFSKGIEALLAQNPEIEIVHREIDRNVVDFIQEYKPDVVIINCDDQEDDLSRAVTCIVKKRLGISVIGLSLNDNRINIYRGQEKQIVNLIDILHAIEG
jgi:DNA-binding NarL/FixJ family response regulator